MQTSDTIKEIIPALIKAQGAMPAVGKGAKNPHFNSTYADLSAIIAVVVPVLSEHGLGYTQSVGDDATETVRVVTRLWHTSGEWLETTVAIPVGKITPHGVGSALTYGRRYGLSALLGIGTEDDDGNVASEQPAPRRQPPPPRKQTRGTDKAMQDIMGKISAFKSVEDLRANTETEKFLDWLALLPAQDQVTIRGALDAKQSHLAARAMAADELPDTM